MKYTLGENAVNSLSIALENFKKFYYLQDKYKESERDEAMKICLVFLENSVELIIKQILVSKKPLSIYSHPDSKVIREASVEATQERKLEDILISRKTFYTIGYSEAVEKYNEQFHKSPKVKSILNSLGERRNAITHFGIDESENSDEFIIVIINTFDVIYNYLYPELIKLDQIGEYFLSDDLIVNTVHGYKPLIDDDDRYNNILDFLDEVLETAPEYALSVRISQIETRIFEFGDRMSEALNDEKFQQMIKFNQANIEFAECNYKENRYVFDVVIKSELIDTIYSTYSMYFNTTIFCNDGGMVYFLVVHGKHCIFMYDELILKWPEYFEPEPEGTWEEDCMHNKCKRYNLSKRNILLVFQHIVEVNIEYAKKNHIGESSEEVKSDMQNTSTACVKSLL